jgi:hypothetical protein
MKITKTELRLIIREEYLRLYEGTGRFSGPGYDANGICTGSVEECSASSLQGSVEEPPWERGR